MSRTQQHNDEQKQYVRGQAEYRSPHAHVETKPSDRAGGRRDSGGGYVRIRSWEHDPTAAGDRKRDVYAYVHRLCAVAWCYPDDMAVAEIISHLADKDVHHNSGVEWDNREDALAVMDHGRHSEVTQAQMRAWAADAKREIASEPAGPPGAEDGRCGQCDEPADVLAESADWDGRYCLACATAASDDAPIEVV